MQRFQMGSQCGNFLARGSAKEHLEAPVNEQRNLAAHQDSSLADAHFTRAQVFDNRPATVASQAAAVPEFHLGRKPELLQTGDTFLEVFDLGLAVTKKHESPL